jgi:eukaryotic-like serine/threonine-protein kinase
VALKMLLPNLAASKAYLERLHHEIVVARRISHPNVCRVYDLGKSGGLHFISMELVEGETLEVRLQREDLSERAVVHVLRQIVVGLDAAHRGGVIHRDLKPANIMINARGHVTVMDFGLARDMNNESTEREKGGGSVVGTPAYWSPEQARGDRATQASDIYSLGVIAYRMFTGSRPQLRTGQDPLLAVREPYRAVISRCLEPDPGKRFASADALLLAFAAAQRDASPVWTSYILGAVGAGVLAAAFLGLRTWWPVHGDPPTASSPPPPMAESVLPSVAAAPVASAAAIPVVPVESLPSSSVSTAAPSSSQHVSSPNVAPRPPAHATTALPHGPSHRRADAPDAAAPVRIPVFD